eukprot:COSAG02_NODE_583_length_20010_cov_4.434584_14_plen_31_part_00
MARVVEGGATAILVFEIAPSDIDLGHNLVG